MPVTKPILVIVPSVMMASAGEQYILDEKAVSGLRLYSSFWPGRVRCVFREGDRETLTFGRQYNPKDLDFEVKKLPRNSFVPDEVIADASIVLASADNWLNFPLAKQMKRLQVPLCFNIEYTLETRLKIIWLSSSTTFRKLKSSVWTIMRERERRRAFSLSSGIQCNGLPATEAYRATSDNTLTYLDTRLSATQIASDENLEAKQHRISQGAPLRLAFTGRLEPMKGASDLIDIAEQLDREGLDFSMQIFGSGSLGPTMRKQIKESRSKSLVQKVKIGDPLDFNSDLVPWLRSEVDLFICCHRQADPSCTYLETLGCAVPILGYANRAWSGLLSLSNAGWETRTENAAHIVRMVRNLESKRQEISEKMSNARNFGVLHTFEAEFEKRVRHLQSTLNLDERNRPRGN